MSEGTASLFSALAEFQKNCPKIDLDGEVRTKRYSFKYATLNELFNKTKKPLAELGLSVIQNPGEMTMLPGEEGQFAIKLETVLIHSSGDSIQSAMDMKVPNTPIKDNSGTIGGYATTPQDVGSAISYARRYAYACILGLIADEDTDGEPVAVLYSGSPADKNWLKEACDKLGITETAIIKDIHDKMLASHSEKDVAVIKKLIK